MLLRSLLPRFVSGGSWSWSGEGSWSWFDHGSWGTGSGCRAGQRDFGFGFSFGGGSHGGRRQGGRGVLLMQSSGVGNVPNMLSLIQSGRFPMLMIITMRGEYGEQNPWQYPMGQAVVPVLEAMGIQCIRVERDDELDQAVESAISASYVAGQGVALILTQKFLGAKAF